MSHIILLILEIRISIDDDDFQKGGNGISIEFRNRQNDFHGY